MEMSRPIMELSELNFDNYFKVSKYRIFSSLLIIVYIWCLPLLSRIGFAEKNKTTISGFIANSHATGALAGGIVFSYICRSFVYNNVLYTTNFIGKNGFSIRYSGLYLFIICKRFMVLVF